MDHTRRNLLVGGSIFGACAASVLLPAACAMYRISGKPATINSDPMRPGGDAKPLLEEDLAPVLARLDAWYAANLAADKYVFNPPASDEELDAFEQEVHISMPRSCRQLYKWHDGENDDRWGHIYGLPILSLERAAAEWRQWQRIAAEFGSRYPVPGKGWPDGAVDSAYTNPS